MYKFETISDASLCLLGETTKLINEIYSNYIIIGGWQPFLKHNGEIVHPGTKDIDILFNGADKENILKEVIELLLGNGYLLSAKHNFQLIKIYNVNGNDMAFNVDLLHPVHGKVKEEDDLFVKQLVLDIPVEKYRSTHFMVMSIVQPQTKYLFDLEMYNEFPLAYCDNLGNGSLSKFNLMNDLGCLLTKSQSCKVRKRMRDSFDIYLTIRQNENYTELINNTKCLKKRNNSTYNSLYGIKEIYEKGTMFTNVQKYCDKISQTDFNNTMNKFIDDVGLNKDAENY
jgi:hypothetical protein